MIEAILPPTTIVDLPPYDLLTCCDVQNLSLLRVFLISVVSNDYGFRILFWPYLSSYSFPLMRTPPVTIRHMWHTDHPLSRSHNHGVICQQLRHTSASGATNGNQQQLVASNSACSTCQLITAYASIQQHITSTCLHTSNRK